VPNLLLQQRGRDTMSVEHEDWSGRVVDPVTAGVDWASTDHAVAVVDSAGRVRERFSVAHRAAELRGLITRLRRARVTEVAIERPDGPVVDALLEAGFSVFVIAPNQIKNLRPRYGQAGNKDDRFDAFVLADVLRTDRARLRPLTRDSEQTITLRMTVRCRQDLVAARVAMANQLRAHLQITLPRAVGLFRDLDSDISLAFLRRFSSQDKADWLSPARLGNWLRAQHYNHLANLDRLWAHLHDAPRGTTSDQAAARAEITLSLVAALSGLRKQIAALDKQIAVQLAAQPDAAIFTSLPKASTVRAARLLAEIGDARGRYPTPEALTCLAGAAPSTRQPRQSQNRGLPLGGGQTTARRRHRLRRRLPPRQPLGRRPLPTSPRKTPRPPPRHPHPRPRLAARHLALLARPPALRPRQTRRTATGSRTSGLTQGYSCRSQHAVVVQQNCSLKSAKT
jgi:transposase